MKKVIVASMALAMIVGCGKVQPMGYSIQALSSNAVVKDMGFQGGRTLSLDLSAPQQTVQSTSDSTALPPTFKGWTVKDIAKYDLTLADITGNGAPQTLITFSVICQEGKAKAVLTNLKPGVKYQITVLAKNAAGTTLNTLSPAIGTFDLTTTPSNQGDVELSTAIRIQLDGAYARSGSIDLLPLDGNTVSDDPEAGQGYCGDCDEERIAGGTTTYDSTFTGGTNGDVFNTDEFQNHWTNEKNGAAWIQRDLDGTYAVNGIFIRHAYSDLRYAPCTSIVLKLMDQDGNWKTVKQFVNTNLHFYYLKLDTPVNAKAFRLEMASNNGWFSASGLALKGALVSGQLTGLQTVGIRVHQQSIKLSEKGTTTVDVFGRQGVDVTQLDLSTVKLSGATVETLGSGAYHSETGDYNNDQIQDLRIHVVAEELDAPSGNDVVLTLTGQTPGGLQVTGQDTVSKIH